MAQSTDKTFYNFVESFVNDTKFRKIRIFPSKKKYDEIKKVLQGKSNLPRDRKNKIKEFFAISQIGDNPMNSIKRNESLYHKS